MRRIRSQRSGCRASHRSSSRPAGLPWQVSLRWSWVWQAGHAAPTRPCAERSVRTERLAHETGPWLSQRAGKSSTWQWKLSPARARRAKPITKIRWVSCSGRQMILHCIKSQPVCLVRVFPGRFADLATNSCLLTSCAFAMVAEGICCCAMVPRRKRSTRERDAATRGNLPVASLSRQRRHSSSPGQNLPARQLEQCMPAMTLDNRAPWIRFDATLLIETHTQIWRYQLCWSRTVETQERTLGVGAGRRQLRHCRPA